MITRSLAQKLARLVPLLASDNDGEALATVRAIGRTLQASGADFHALAASLERMQVTVTAPLSERDSRSGPTSQASYNFANAFRQADPVGGAPDHPDAMSRRFGLPIYRQDQIESWFEVTRHCLELNRVFTKKEGGRFLRDFETKLLIAINTGKRWPTNSDAAWIETVVARCHQARDAARAKRGGGNG